MPSCDAGAARNEGTSTVTEEQRLPPLAQVLSSDDFEDAARRVLSTKAYAFYSSAATDLITRDANRSFYNRVWLRPRVLRDVRRVSTRSHMLGEEVAMPLFVSPASMGRLGHPDGEAAIARACAARHVFQGVSNYSSVPLEKIVAAPATAPATAAAAAAAAGRDAASGSEGRFIFQLYVNRDRRATEEALQRCARLPQVRAIFVTVDAAWPGKREGDERVQIQDAALRELSPEASGRNDGKGGGIGRLLSGGIDPGLSWRTLRWLRGKTALPLILKGVMSADDAMLALDAGMDGIYLSNHGGRNLDTAPPALLTLLELHKRCPAVFDKMEVYVDGGIRRGTDILKALCLGATAVGVGRPALYANVYGAEGVEKLIDVLQDELATSVRLIGVTSVDELGPEYVNTGDLDHLVPASSEHPYARKTIRRSKRDEKL
ncbi:hypothetical protein KEM52_000186 [Ascosphaera acerosa]|nr:hypothetical protein KEM52_000186 [Ascosphaera acerosa]